MKTQKPNYSNPVGRWSPLQRAALAALAAGIVLAGVSLGTHSIFAQELIYQEGFNDDGSAATPPRYVITGRDVYTPDRLKAEVDPATQQLGMAFWAHNFDLPAYDGVPAKFVGVPGATPARRALLAWDGAITATEASDKFFTLFDATVKWLLNNKANATIVFQNGASGAQSLADRLTASGHTVVDDDSTIDQTAVKADLVIKIPGNFDASRFARVAIPVLTFDDQGFDDMVVAKIGTSATFEAGDATIVTASHPAAGGLTGSFPVATGEHTWHIMGDQLPEGAITVANFVRRIPPTIATLADVDAIIAGTKQSDKTTGTVDALDFSDNSPGNWQVDNPIPGGATGDWGILVTGKLTVSTAGTYSFALGTDDGGRLQIDINKNGFDAADTIVEDLGPHTHTLKYGNANFTAAGTYDFRVVGYNSAGNGDLEVSVATTAGAGKNNLADSPGDWEVLGVSGAVSPVKVAGSLDVTAYVASGAVQDLTIPLIVLLNGPNDTPPGNFFGGGPFVGFEGTGFFAGAALNKFGTADDLPRTVTLKTIDVTGKPNLKLTVALSASFLDFETSDYLNFKVYEEGTDPTSVSPLIHFTAPSDNDKFFNDVGTHPSNPTKLGLRFQDVTYNIPAGIKKLVVRAESVTTWWNEIVAFDHIRITSGAAQAPPTISIARNGANLEVTFTGTLQSASKVDGQFTAVPGNPQSPVVLKPADLVGTTFYRAQGQ